LEGELVLQGIWGAMQRNKDISGGIMSSCCMEDTKSSAGCGFEQPGLVEGVPAHGRGIGTR